MWCPELQATRDDIAIRRIRIAKDRLDNAVACAARQSRRDDEMIPLIALAGVLNKSERQEGV